jgi:hypothetical protein
MHGDVPNAPSFADFLAALHSEPFALYMDDSGRTGRPQGADPLAENYAHIHGVVVPSEFHAALLERHAAWLAMASACANTTVKELHTKELVNPTSKSSWHGVSIESRRTALVAAYEMLWEVGLVLPWLGVPEAQYRVMLAAADGGHPHWFPWQRHKPGIEMVMLKAVASSLSPSDPRFVVVSDNNDVYRDALVQLFADEVPIWQNGVVYSDSRALPGLQLADLAAYTFLRQMTIYDRRRAGEGSKRFDDIIEAWALRLTERRVHVLAFERDEYWRERMSRDQSTQTSTQ